MIIKDKKSAKDYYLKKNILGWIQFEKNGNLLNFDCAGVDNVTDDDVQYIIYFPEIQAISVSGKKITDNSLDYFRDLNNLKSITFHNTSISGKNFQKIINKSSLNVFDFKDSPIVDEGIKLLSEIEYKNDIEFLNLNNTKITDEGMKYISKMKIGKAFISLFNTKVTDEGIKHLAGFKELKEIDLRETKVTDKGGKWLQEQLPNTEIYWGKYIPDTPTGMDEEE